MKRSRPRLGYEYKVIVIQPDSNQVQKTRFVTYDSPHVGHAEAMKVLKENRAIRDAGCVVRMIRYEFGEPHPLDWSDNGRNWRPFNSSGPEFNQSIEDVRKEELEGK